ncbi:porin [Sphingobacterium sp. KU25419]|nr:porin [Sphingobacterium sp. KU25419]
MEISGSVDTYWKYDFQKQPNINTYFTEDNNSVSIGMVDLALKKLLEKHLLLVSYPLDQEDNIDLY